MDDKQFDAARREEIEAEVRTLTEAVREAARARLAFDDEPAAFASLMEREAK